MTERDPDAWWSPVPGLPPSSPPPAETTHPGPWPAPGLDASRPDLPAAGARRRRTRPWVVGGAAAVALLVCGVLVATLGGAATKTLMDPDGTVSIAVPRSWYDNSGDPRADPDEPAVLVSSNLWQDRWVVVDRWDVDDDDTLASFHEEGVSHECAQQRCASRSGARSLDVGGHVALEQVVVHPSDATSGASTLVVLTVWLDDRAVEVYAGATADGDTAPDPAPLETIAGSLRVL